MNDTPATPQQPEGDAQPPRAPQTPRYAPPQVAPPVTPPQTTPPRYAPPQYSSPQYNAVQPVPQQPLPPQPPAQQWAPTQQYAPSGQPYVVPGQPYAYPPYQGLPAPGPGEPFDGAAHPADPSRPLYGASLPQAFTRFFKNYAVFSGRASSSEFWWVALIFGVGLSLLTIVTGALLDAMHLSASISYSFVDGVETLFALCALVIWVGLLIPSLAITWRRLHDADLAGPFFFLGCVPFFGGLVLLILLVLPPKVSGRRFTRNR